MKAIQLKKIRKNLGLTQTEFGKMLGVGIRTVQSWESGSRNITESTKMLLESKLKPEQSSYNTEAIEVDFTQLNVMFVPLVSKFAYAGYLDNLGDDEYVGDLPKIPFANDVQNKGNYLCFEVRGDSMHNEKDDAIKEGDILLCRNVRQDLWMSKLFIHKYDFVIVHKERGILIKRITEHNTTTHELTLHSLNDYYDDIKIHLKDVKAIYNVVDLRRKRNRR